MLFNMLELVDLWLMGKLTHTLFTCQVIRNEIIMFCIYQDDGSHTIDVMDEGRVGLHNCIAQVTV